MSSIEPTRTTSESDKKDLEAMAHVQPVTADVSDAAGIALVEEHYILPVVEGYQRKTTKLSELYAYYAYYMGNSGIGSGIMAPGLMQSYMYDYAYDPSILPHVPGNCTDRCYLDFAGSSKPLNSVVLDASGIQFAIQLFISLIFGGWLDYTSKRRYVVAIATFLCAIFGLCWLGVKGGDQWMSGVGISIASSVCYYISFAYFQAAMPGLAYDLPEMQEAEHRVLDGTLSPHVYKENLMLVRNKIGNLGYTMCGFGPFLISLPAVGIAKALNPNVSGEANERAYRIILAYLAGCLILFVLPWTFLEQTRPAQKLPDGANIYTVGFRNYWETGKEILKLKQTLLYLLAVVLIGEAVNTTSTLTYTLQYAVSSYDLQTTLWMTLMSYGVQGAGTWLVYFIQQKLRLSTKTMMQVTSFGSLCCIVWGFVGIWTPNFGFKNLWEIWLFNAWFGFAMCPFFQLSLTMIAEVAPAPKIFMFWSFFALFGRASAFVGPFITSAIIDDAQGNNNMGYAFLLPLMLLGMLVLSRVDTAKSALECKAFLQNEAKVMYHKDGKVHLTE